jgi:hypothetical protein
VQETFLFYLYKIRQFFPDRNFSAGMSLKLEQLPRNPDFPPYVLNFSWVLNLHAGSRMPSARQKQIHSRPEASDLFLLLSDYEKSRPARFRATSHDTCVGCLDWAGKCRRANPMRRCSR